MRALCIILASAVGALAAPGDPGETAVQFLEKVRGRNLNLDPGTDTALAPQTSEPKRREIARRLERVAGDLGSSPLEIGPVNLDGELAAVLVRKIGGFDPGRLQVFPVALVKRGAGWLAAPVPASFENAGVGYAASLRERLAKLEEWMLREQARDLETLREQSESRMRLKISEKLNAATLLGLDSRQTAGRFVDACERRSQPEMLGLLGGLSKPLPADWSARLKAVEEAAGRARCPRPWSLLVAPEVLRVIIRHEEDESSAMTTLACLDPNHGAERSGNPRVELVDLELEKSADGLWRVNPPAGFLSDSTEEEDDTEYDADLLNRFPAMVAAAHPAAPAESAALARDALLKAFADTRPGSWVRLLPAHEDAGHLRYVYAQAARAWWSLRNPESVRQAVSLGLREQGDLAVVTCQFFDARHPDRLDLRHFVLEKSAAGWFWNPTPSAATRGIVDAWAAEQDAHWQDRWQEVLLADCPELDSLPAGGAPADDECRALVHAWLKAIRGADVEAALRLTARLKTPESATTLLRNLGYELNGARLFQQADTVTAVHHGSILSAVGVKTNPEGKPNFPLYPVVATPRGPRILLEIDLFASRNRNRDFLNETALKNLRRANPAAADELQRHFEKHQAASTPREAP